MERYFAIIFPITCKQILTPTRLRVSTILFLLFIFFLLVSYTINFVFMLLRVCDDIIIGRLVFISTAKCYSRCLIFFLVDGATTLTDW